MGAVSQNLVKKPGCKKNGRFERTSKWILKDLFQGFFANASQKNLGPEKSQNLTRLILIFSLHENLVQSVHEAGIVDSQTLLHSSSKYIPGGLSALTARARSSLIFLAHPGARSAPAMRARSALIIASTK